MGGGSVQGRKTVLLANLGILRSESNEFGPSLDGSLFADFSCYENWSVVSTFPLEYS